MSAVSTAGEHPAAAGDPPPQDELALPVSARIRARLQRAQRVQPSLLSDHGTPVDRVDAERALQPARTVEVFAAGGVGDGPAADPGGATYNETDGTVSIFINASQAPVLSATNAGTTISVTWQAMFEASSYDVIRGLASGLTQSATQINLGSVTWVENDSPDPLSTETGNPPLGSTWFYLMRTQDPYVKGSYGRSTLNKIRIPTGGLPLAPETHRFQRGPLNARGPRRVFMSEGRRTLRMRDNLTEADLDRAIDSLKGLRIGSRRHTMLGGMLSAGLGLERPQMPPGLDMRLLGLWTTVAGLGMSIGLAEIARRITGGKWVRWLTLAWFTYTCMGINNTIEARNV